MRLDAPTVARYVGHPPTIVSEIDVNCIFVASDTQPDVDQRAVVEGATFKDPSRIGQCGRAHRFPVAIEEFFREK
jgi:hypothetical protein